jgi:asparagine synthase (glutamine-hydrolysing)
MFRFIALVWDRRDPMATHAASSVVQKLTDRKWRAVPFKGLTVCYTDERPGSSEVLILSGGGGVILGKIFKALNGRGASPGDVCVVRETEQIRRSAGAWLVQNYWGRYVAFIQDKGERLITVIRDPIGELPCFRTTSGAITYCFSDPQDCVMLGIRRFTVNWDYLGLRMCAPLLTHHSSACGLNEVVVLPAGECWDVSPSRVGSRRLWHPMSFAAGSPLESVTAAAREVREVAQGCIDAWASCYPRIVQLLSGGLDSSVVAACLKHSPTHPTVTCLHHYYMGSGSDERVLARLAARNAGMELIERESRASDLDFQSIFKVSRSVSPWPYLFFVQQSRIQGELAAAKGATAIFNGVGGDQLFFQNPVAISAADYYFHYGISAGFLGTVLSVSRLQGLSFWKLLADSIRTVRRAGRYRHLCDPAATIRLAGRAVVDQVTAWHDLIPELLRAAKDVAPGKQLHLLFAAMPHEIYDPLGSGDYPERVRPLVSQPLVELCLRIPTYTLTDHGWDRAVERRAFYEMIPREIANRRAKGNVGNYVGQLLETHLQSVREVLLDGELVRRGFIDRRRLEEILQPGRASLAPEATEIMIDHLSAEVWLQGWSTMPHRSAEAA